MRADVEQALQTLQQAQPQGLERALALLQDTIFSFSLKVCGHRQDAEDTMQQTLLKTARHLKGFDSPKALAVWLYKVAKNHCLMNRRKSKFAPAIHLSLEELMPQRRDLLKLSAERIADPEQALLQSESRQQVQRAVLKLPPAYRLVLVLHDMEGLSTEEVARVLNIREGTARVRLHRARVFLRNELARRPAPATGRPAPAEKRPPRCRQLFAELSDYLDGALDASLCEELEKHLDGCAPCQTFLDSLEQTVVRCRLHHLAPLSPKAAARTRRTVRAEYERAVAGLKNRR
jgi:RNA polymerase sigma-70 factor (ECF subfamily)